MQDILVQTAKAAEAISIAANDATKLILQTMPDGDERRQVLEIVRKIVLGDQNLKNSVLVLQGQELKSPGQIAAAVVPILKEIRAAIDQGLQGIQNLDTQKQARGRLDAVSITVITIQGVLEVYHGPA